MTKITKYLGAGLLGAWLILLPFRSSESGVIKKYDPASTADDLFILGFGELSLHSMSVHGNVGAFEASNPWLKEGLTSNYRTSLFANGNLNRKLFINGAVIVDSRVDDEYRNVDPSVFRLRMSVKSTEPLWDGWRFTGEGLYDPQRRWEVGNLDTRLLMQPQKAARLELLARLESNKYGYIEGGSLRPSFKNSIFSLHQRSLFGVFADLKTGKFGAEGVGGKLEGKSFREGAVVGIRANGTTGPFDLSNAPITRGSEEIKIEVRDRFDSSTVISSRTLVSDVDYSIDYLRGRIVLSEPVASETVASDPVFVVITYDYQRDNNDELIGGRLSFNSNKDMMGGASFLHRFRDDSASGIGENEPDNLGTADFSFKLDKVGSGYFEIANSDDKNMDGSSRAYRAGLESRIVNKLTVSADFQRIDDQFLSFTNSDLNPTKNQQRLSLGGNYDINKKQLVNVSYRNITGLEAAGEYNSYPGRRDEKRYILGYRNRFSESLKFGVMLERRDVFNKDNPLNEDNHQDRLTADLEGTKNSFGLLSQFSYGLHYELIAFRNDLNIGMVNSNSNLIALSLASKSEKGNFVRLIQKMRLLENDESGNYIEREDGTFLTLRIQPRQNISTLTTGEYKRFTRPADNLSLWQDSPFRIQRSGTLALEYLPFEKLKAVGKVGRYDLQRWAADSTSRSTDDFIQGQVVWFYNHHLSLSAENEYRFLKNEGIDPSRNKTWDIGLRFNWNRDRLNQANFGFIRRRQVSEYPPAPELKSVSYILLAGGSASLWRNYFVRGSVKTLLLRESLDDEKTYLQLEAGYELKGRYRFSIGYERIENNLENYPDRYYRGHGIFIRLTGKI
jgi:hypothetical protein